MVAHLGLRANELYFGKSDIAEMLSACVEAECYKRVANHSQCKFT